MAFNLQTWREQCKTLLESWKERLADRKADSIYGIIASAVVMPNGRSFQT